MDVSADSASTGGGGDDDGGGGDDFTQSLKIYVFMLESRQVQLPPEDELDDHECPFL